MGVKGLTTYINRNSNRYLAPHELHDCNLVIDGNNLACQLYKWHARNSAYGGDYDNYAEHVINFFHVLEACNVKAYVVMDGGYEPRKLKTVYSRLRQKIITVSKCTPATQSVIQVFPLFLKYTFKDVLFKLSIPFAQCDFEADEEIAAVARKLGCPVLSLDSDFFIYNVPYIPFSTCELNSSKKKQKGGREVTFLKCKIYHVKGLLQHFGGLNEKLLPLMAVLLGNDYVQSSLFKNFFLHVKLPSSKSMSKQHKKIATVIEWLKKETVDSAMTKILSKFKKERRAFLTKIFERSIRIYSEEFSHTLKYLGLACDTELPGSTTSALLPAFELDDEVIEDIHESLSENLDAEAGDSEEQSGSQSEDHNASDKSDLEIENCPTQVNKRGSFPPWLLDHYRRGLIDPALANIFYLGKYFCEPQVEDFTLTPSYELSLPILRVIFGLLVMNDDVLSEDEEFALNFYGRTSFGKPKKMILTPVFETISVKNFCSLSFLPSWPDSTKLSVLLDTLVLCNKDDLESLSTFPNDWKLYAMTVVYWGRENKEWPQVTNCHVHALVLCIIALSVIDRKLGFFRSNSAFLKKYGNKLRKARSTQNEQSPQETSCSGAQDNVCQKQLESNQSNPASQMSRIETALEKVSVDDCLFLEKSMIEYHLGKDSSSSYSLTDVHSFAQFQNCLNQAMCLNSLLGFPVPHCSVANFYSGKFLNSVYADFSKRSNVELYIDLVMKSSPTIRELHRAIAETFFGLLPNLLKLVRRGKNKRKKKSSKKKVVEEHSDGSPNDSDSSVGEDISCDIENRFSLLKVQ